MDTENCSSKLQSNVIKPIDRNTVHRICSGQVVLSLAIALKELVENAIDAQATIIYIHLKEYGADVIEVSDNGNGVIKENFQALTLKHYTSKIEQFNDLENISTLGFRGEALSSLCALADLTILTKHTSAEFATKITYDRNGKITSESIGARENGTTVTLENLFSTLPVRRREFLNNLKREFNKMCQLLYAYCLMPKGIKFTCSNTTTKGSRNIVVQTDGFKTVKENIINVFGSKQISTLVDVEIIQPNEAILNEYGLKSDEDLPFSFEFMISSVTHGSGRSSNDRQFYYINSRPCEPTKVMKLVNEIYKQFNSSQYPFVYLNVTSKSSLVDVNVTPDKRQIFLEKEKILLATLKMSLLETFKTFPSTYKMQNLDLSQNSTINDFFSTTRNTSKGLKRTMTDTGIKQGSLMEKFKKRSKTENDKDQSSKFDRVASITRSIEREVDSKLDSFVKTAEQLLKNSEETWRSVNIMNDDTVMEEVQVCKKSHTSSAEQIINAEDIKLQCQVEEKDCKFSAARTEEKTPLESCKTSVIAHDSGEPEICSGSKISIVEEIVKIEETEIQRKYDSEFSTDSADSITNNSKPSINLDTPFKETSIRKSLQLSVSLDDIRNLIKKKEQNQSRKADVCVRFRSEITPEANKTAEEELNKQISKDDFKKMSIIGQFNLGFIITKLKNDLFIVDQHATDEKYNFEQLQLNTVLDHQVLVNPKPLELTAGNESLLIENEEIFKRNGFAFKIDHSAPCTKKVSIIAIPISKSFAFGKDDIDEMLFMLQDSNGTMCRPSRVRGMFASRACRKSVMIGKSLSKSDMRRLIDHMGEIDQPWNCPHGRPTMRHLINLDLIDQKE